MMSNYKEFGVTVQYLLQQNTLLSIVETEGVDAILLLKATTPPLTRSPTSKIALLLQ